MGNRNENQTLFIVFIVFVQQMHNVHCAFVGQM